MAMGCIKCVLFSVELIYRLYKELSLLSWTLFYSVLNCVAKTEVCGFAAGEPRGSRVGTIRMGFASLLAHPLNY